MNGNVCIRTYTTRLEAEFALGLLEAEGIDAVVLDEETGQAESEPGPVRLCVIPDDADRAVAVLDSPRAG